MIQRFVDAWEKNKPLIRRMFADKHPEDYDDVVLTVLTGLQHESPARLGYPDPAATLVIEGASYQGTNTYVLVDSCLGEPQWYVRVDYGSCGHCDTLCSIKEIECGDRRPTEDQVNEYMTLALHIVQRINEFE